MWRFMLVLVVSLPGFCSGLVPGRRLGGRITLQQRPARLQQGGGSPSMALEAAGLWQDYLGLLETAPLATKSVTAAVIIGSGDATAQWIEATRSEAAVEDSAIDIARVGRWAAFGLLLQAPWNHFFYLALDGALPPTVDPFTTVTATKVFIDQFIQAPIFTSIIFVFFAVVEGKGLGFAKSQLQNELMQVLLKNWAVFLPATAINLAFLPNELRVLFLNGVFFFWVIYLSLTVNAKQPPDTTTT
uniref:Peroxisomal membrane protein MPV17 n=1 Tax=Rhizochromulina marina TaxID=1034831 RepID=A0A7S2WUE7_9STRA|mmetsp:Transcript_6040/g.17635  ORF Transcript_6040/g.17635 Transcript_6040/m.17635 type:complete len:244 (+) Transcript_6040:96-827(+)